MVIREILYLILATTIATISGGAKRPHHTVYYTKQLVSHLFCFNLREFLNLQIVIAEGLLKELRVKSRNDRLTMKVCLLKAVCMFLQVHDNDELCMLKENTRLSRKLHNTGQ